MALSFSLLILNHEINLKWL